MRNVLFIINHNSTYSADLLLQRSNLSVLGIVRCVIYSNGVSPPPDFIDNWTASLLEKGIIFSHLVGRNDGYGAAINRCIALAKSDFVNYDYAFFSNADLTVQEGTSTLAYNSFDVVGFPMYQGGKFIVSKVSIFTPLLPFRFRKYLRLKPEYGSASIVHGCFFGMRVHMLLGLEAKFFEDYFLYWEETQFFYELSKLGFKIGVSDSVKINHDGEKSVVLDNARYYMFRNGLFFYRYIYKSFILFAAWFLINYLYACKSSLRVPFKLPSWYVQAKSDFLSNSLGKRDSSA